jgi:hypothetical protein
MHKRLAAMTIGLIILADACAQTRPPSSVVIPRHTALKFTLIQPLDSATARVNDEILLRLARPLVVNGTVVLPEGWVAYGRITKVERARKGRDGEIAWTLNRIALPDSTALKAKVLFVDQNPDAIVEDSYKPKASKACPDVCGKDAAGLLLMTIVALPVLLPMAILERDHGNYSVGSEYFLPPGSTVAVVLAKNHRIHL